MGIESTCIAGDTGDADLIPGSGRSSGGENGTLFQYSSLKNIMDREVWQATFHGVAKSWTWQTTHSFLHMCVCVCMCVYFMFYSIIRYYYKILSAFHMLYLLVKFMKKYVIFTVLNAELIHKFSTFLQSQSFILHPFTLPCLPEQLSFKAQRGKHK